MPTKSNERITDKEILEVAFDRGANYKPWAEDLDPQWYYIKGFEDGAKWANKPVNSDLNMLLAALEFYANPENYFGIGFIPDKPCGDFIFDFSDTELGYKPGNLARETLNKYNKG